MRYELEIQTSHFQFLVGDRKRGPLANTTPLWKGGGGAVATSPDLPEVVGIGTVRYGGLTRVSVEITDTRPSSNEDWTELGCFSIDVTSASLALWGPEEVNLGTMRSIPLPSGRYSGVVLLHGAEEPCDEAAQDGPEEYRLVLWPSHFGEGSK